MYGHYGYIMNLLHGSYFGMQLFCQNNLPPKEPNTSPVHCKQIFFSILACFTVQTSKVSKIKSWEARLSVFWNKEGNLCKNTEEHTNLIFVLTISHIQTKGSNLVLHSLKDFFINLIKKKSCVIFATQVNAPWECLEVLETK